MSVDIGLIIAITGSTIAIVAVIMAMMFWVRQEANTLRSEAKEDRKDLIQLSRNIENTITAIQAEIKDFHTRLLQIELRK